MYFLRILISSCIFAQLKADSTEDLFVNAATALEENETENDILYDVNRDDRSMENMFSSASAAINSSESDQDILYHTVKELHGLTHGMYLERTNEERALYIGEGCDMPLGKREACPGIADDSCSINCHRAGCCYDDTAAHGVLSCFKRANVKQFKIVARTGTIKWSDSTNPMYIRLFGTQALCDEVRLDPPFHSGSVRAFDIDCGTYIGILKELKIRIDGADGWYVETIDVTNTFGDTETFRCNKWVDEYETVSCGYCASLPCRNGGTCVQTLTGYKCACDPGYIGHNCETARRYRVSITTATSPADASSNADVYLTMVGVHGRCEEKYLNTPADDMEKGNTDHHYVQCSSPIGDLAELQFRSTTNDRWDFTTVVVESSHGTKTYNCNLSVNVNQPAVCYTTA